MRIFRVFFIIILTAVFISVSGCSLHESFDLGDISFKSPSNYKFISFGDKKNISQKKFYIVPKEFQDFDVKKIKNYSGIDKIGLLTYFKDYFTGSLSGYENLTKHKLEAKYGDVNLEIKKIKIKEAEEASLNKFKFDFSKGSIYFDTLVIHSGNIFYNLVFSSMDENLGKKIDKLIKTVKFK